MTNPPQVSKIVSLLRGRVAEDWDDDSSLRELALLAISNVNSWQLIAPAKLRDSYQAVARGANEIIRGVKRMPVVNQLGIGISMEQMAKLKSHCLKEAENVRVAGGRPRQERLEDDVQNLSHN